MVGLGRLELPTSRLSSARSNQLSYKPVIQRSRSLALARQRHGARPRRKRNVDGGVPPVGLMTEPLMFLSDPIAICVMQTSEGSSLERR
jgi:hypothetical protein